MTLDFNLENEIGISRLVTQADGVVVLAYSGKTGGCGARLLTLLEELASSLPVLIIQPEMSENNELAGFKGAVIEVKLGPSDSEQSQNAGVMSAMRDFGIRAPILILLNPLFIPFWERAFGGYRMFAVTEQFRSETGNDVNAGADEAGEREKKKRILLFERSVDSVLFEEDGDIEWMRREFVYHGVSHRIDDFIKSAHASMLDLSKEAISKQSRYPHRLDILILVDDSETGQDLLADEAVSIYCHCSRHQVYFALKRSNKALASADSIPDYRGFDVLIIDQSSDSKLVESMEKGVVDAVKGFSGLKGVLIKGEVDDVLEETETGWGIHFLISEDAVGQKGEQVSKLDAFMSSLMPGLPSWQLHHAGSGLSHQAWTYKGLVAKYADEDLEIEDQNDPIAELDLLDREKAKFERELDGMRKEVVAQDELILELTKEHEELKHLEQIRRKKKEGLGFIKKTVLKIRGKW